MVRVAPRYVIADPIREPMPIEEEHPVDESLIEDLKRLAERLVFILDFRDGALQYL